MVKYLTKTEESELVSKIRNGDESAKEELIKYNRDYMCSIAKRFARRYPGIGLDEFVSAGYLAMVEALKGFDPTKNTKFITYIKRGIEQRMSRVVAEDPLITVPSGRVREYYEGSNDPDVRCVLEAEYVSLSSENDNGSLLSDILPAEQEDIETILDREHMLEKIDNLVDQFVLEKRLKLLEGEIIKERARGTKLRKVGRKINRTGERVRQILEKKRVKIATAKIREALG